MVNPALLGMASILTTLVLCEWLRGRKNARLDWRVNVGLILLPSLVGLVVLILLLLKFSR